MDLGTLCLGMCVGGPTRCKCTCASEHAYWRVEEEGELMLFDVLIMHVRA